MYITPRVLIQQEFLQLPVYAENPLPAFIVGPQFALTRYSNASEKPFTALGHLDGNTLETGNNYNATTDTRYDFPNVPAGGNVDHSFTKVYAEAVEAQYFPLVELGDPGMGGDAVTFVVSPSGQSYHNKVRFTDLVLATGNGASRSDVFSQRDVRVGDLIEVTDNLGNTVKGKILTVEAESANENEDLASLIAPVLYSGTGAFSGTTFTASGNPNFEESAVVGQYITIADVGVRKVLAWTNSTTLVLDRAPSSSVSGKAYHIGGVYNDLGNAEIATEDHNNAPVFTGTSGDDADVTVSNVSTAYKGYNSYGILSDTYTIRVTGGSTLSDVNFSIASQSGAFSLKESVTLVDDVLVVDDSNGNEVALDFTGSTAFVLNSTWTLSVVAGVTQVVPQANGDIYTGAVDMTYRIFVERGGAFYDGTNSTTCARLLITASDVDTSSVVLPHISQYFNLGRLGVSAKFTAASNNGGLIAGDVYYINVKAAKPGAYTIVSFDEAIPAAMLSLSSSRTAKLYLTQRVAQIPEVKDLLTDDRNWTQEDSYITIMAGITTYDYSLLAGGQPARLPVKAAKLFVEHRDLLQDNVTSIDAIRSLADVQAKLGTIHPDNPLAQGVYDAVLNAQNQVVYFIGVPTNDLAGYLEAIKISEKSDKVYSFVPLTFDRAIQDAIVSHVNAYSTPEVGRWRICWLSVRDEKTRLIYDLQDNGRAYQATITDDPAVSGTQHKLVTVEGAKFVDDGVRPNDTIRVNFRLNADGNMIYDEYVVDHVRTNTTLTLTRALSAPINLPVKVQVVRNFTKTERANNIAYVGGSYNNRRVRVVFPDTFVYNDNASGGVEVIKEGYFAAAGLAGLRSGVVPHQGLTNSEYLGATKLNKVVLEFSQSDLDTMAEQGIWIITQETIGATAYVRHQLTTDTSSLNTSEDSITTNVDSISYALKRVMAPFIGRYNVNPDSIATVRAAIVGELTYRSSNTFTNRAGNQLVSFTPKDDILRLEQNATYKDRLDVEVRLHVPYPLNYLSLKLIVGA
jgi:hypothetical protein